MYAQGLMVILGGLMVLSLVLCLHYGKFHFDHEREKARWRRWWDRKE